MPRLARRHFLAIERLAPGNQRHDLGALDLRLARLDREFLRMIAPFAIVAQRTDQTHRLARQADGRAEFHHSLVVRRWIVPVEKFVRDDLQFRPCLWLRNVVPQRKNAGQDTHDVSIQHGQRQAKGDAAHGGGGVRTNARQSQKALLGLRHDAHLRHRFRQGVEIARAAIIAQSFPRLEHVMFLRPGQRLPRREDLQPSLVIRNHRHDLCLLEHQLGNRDGVGITGASPRQIAPGGAVPFRELAAQPGPGDFGHREKLRVDLVFS